MLKFVVPLRYPAQSTSALSQSNESNEIEILQDARTHGEYFKFVLFLILNFTVGNLCSHLKWSRVLNIFSDQDSVKN